MLRPSLKVILCAALLLPTAAHATLIKQNDLIFDTGSGLSWVPVAMGGPGALALEDLAPGTRYASSLEVNDLLDRYVRVYVKSSCDNPSSFSPGPCSPPAYQAIVSFMDLFGALDLGGRHWLQAVYDADEMFSMTLSLSAVDATYSLGYFDQQGGNGVPLSGEFGMLLISAVPEPSTLVLFSIG